VLFFSPNRKNSRAFRDFIHRGIFDQILQLLLALRVAATGPRSDVDLARRRIIVEAAAAEFDAENLRSDVALSFLAGLGLAQANISYRAIPTFAERPY
jgi:hypothetical protein